ncbi:hypothetical protein [Aestuariispira insulae]|uniref:Uncharacterized protein n=1 Tax=Aestuariispira insulae TaxID=1461337 RepID=A0A3D9H3M4_9PROT|nr:hypothetical protein [Aestuariispira insulae]RED44104.1 hypothetical protein DFP90_1177 [Aestuariispira insulae]
MITIALIGLLAMSFAARADEAFHWQQAESVTGENPLKHYFGNGYQLISHNTGITDSFKLNGLLQSELISTYLFHGSAGIVKCIERSRFFVGDVQGDWIKQKSRVVCGRL